jgi:regulation of enolase protein 1 (concanavalin A-like superfamily)
MRHQSHYWINGLLTIAILLVSLPVAMSNAATNWSFSDRDYRLAITVAADDTPRTDRPVETDVDFATLLNDLGATGTFDEDSLRVVEVDAAGDSLDTAVPFQFDNGSTVDNPSGQLVFLPSGTTAANTTRYFYVYFDETGSFTSAPQVNERVSISTVADYRGQESFEIMTRDADGTRNTTYYYHKEGAAFAGIIDRDNNDWISYYPDSNSRSGGAYRGLPNIGPVFHPGYSNSSGEGQGSVSTIVDQGPLKLTIRSVSYDDQYEAIWEIYPRYATMTLLRTADNYWFLYEGTPGGSLDYTGANQDYIVRSDGTQSDISSTWGDDLSPEWVYFGDPTLNRVLYLAHGNDDAHADSSLYQHNSDQTLPAGTVDNGAMTVFAFGRPLGTTIRSMTVNNAEFTVGFAEQNDFSEISDRINSAAHDLSVTLTNAETQDGGSLVLAASEPTNTSTPSSEGANLQSDDFNSTSLNTDLWTFIDPRGDSSVTLDGTNALISVPAGTSHDIWTGGNNTPRLMQAAPNTDFEVEVKFESQPVGQYALQGLLVEADANNFIRFDFYSDGADPRIFAARFVDGNPTVEHNQAIGSNAPLYMRITRVGNTWTQSYSDDGSTWQTAAQFTHGLAVASVGVFAGNAGNNPPAFTGAIDYVFNTTTPIVPEDDEVPATSTPTQTPTNTPTNTPVLTDTDVLTDTPTMTPTQTPTMTPTEVPTEPVGLVSDDFNNTTLDTDLWTFVDPRGDATLTLDGTTAQIAIPAGTSHDIWSGGNYAPRLMQAAPNTDFEMEVKFESLPSQAYALQGILVEADADNFIRFDFYSDSTGPRVFAAHFVDGNPTAVSNQAIADNTPLYLRVTRVGDNWTQAYSYDGSTWQTAAQFSHSLAVTAVGVFAGNAGSNPPAFTGAIDYVFNTAAPIVPEDGVAPPTSTPTMTPTNTPTDDPTQPEPPTATPTMTSTPTPEPQSEPTDLVSDDFNNTTLDTDLWTFVDPRGDATLTLDGTTVLLSVPSGTDHDIWTGDVNAPRLMQTISDTDFEVEVKFESQPAGRYTLQGLLVEADANNFMRFDFYSDGTDLRVFAARFVNGSPTAEYNQVITSDAPLYMRVTRVGDTWTQTYSYDGSTWQTAAQFSHSLVVTSVGVFAGNAGNNPAFTANIDYVFNTAAPIVPEDGVVPATNTPTMTPTNTPTDDPTQPEPPTATPTMTSTPTPESQPEPTDLVSDDFNSLSLNSDVWTFVDPRGDSTLTLNGTNALISVPSGTSHDVWSGGINAPRLVQTVSDTDFEIEVKFESQPVGQYALQGLLVEADANNFIRFDFYSDGADPRVFAARFVNGSPSVEYNQSITGDAPLYMRVTRVGNTWTQAYSYDGSTWQTAAQFSHTLAVASVGVFAGNAGNNPAFTGAIDYVFNTASPIEPEDADTSLDTTPPIISNVQYTLNETTLNVTWLTNELATGQVEYGETLTYGSVAEHDGMSTSHSVTITNLLPETFYHFRAISTNTNGYTAYSQDFVVRSGDTEVGGGPQIDIWYGAEQPFGQYGTPQQWVNILGNVSDPDGVSSLVYSLNGGPASILSQGPDRRRLVNAGDFNVEIDYADLQDGVNTVTIMASDDFGNHSTRQVQVTYTPGQSWSLPTSIDWSSAATIQDIAQIVDGLWIKQSDSVRVVEAGYDRLIALGDIAWTDYEVTVPITVHEWYNNLLIDEGGLPGVGVLIRWDGHDAWYSTQPRYGWHPLGALGWYRYQNLEIIGGVGGTIATDTSGFQMQTDVRYILKLRVESRPGQTSIYHLKMWEDGTPEPIGWQLSAAGEQGELSQGSALLVAHKVDATFGNVSVVPVTPE